jgi:hypothetical protein
MTALHCRNKFFGTRFGVSQIIGLEGRFELSENLQRLEPLCSHVQWEQAGDAGD